jgi:hypothetical protein
MDAVLDPAVSVSATADFAYSPPVKARQARRILVKPNLGYLAKPPVIVSLGVLCEVLRGLRRVSPEAEILIVEGVASSVPLADIICDRHLTDYLDDRMPLLDTDSLALNR